MRAYFRHAALGLGLVAVTGATEAQAVTAHVIASEPVETVVAPAPVVPREPARTLITQAPPAYIMEPDPTAVAPPPGTFVVRPAGTIVGPPVNTFVVPPAAVVVTPPAETVVRQPGETVVTRPVEATVTPRTTRPVVARSTTTARAVTVTTRTRTHAARIAPQRQGWTLARQPDRAAIASRPIVLTPTQRRAIHRAVAHEQVVRASVVAQPVLPPPLPLLVPPPVTAPVTQQVVAAPAVTQRGVTVVAQTETAYPIGSRLPATVSLYAIPESIAVQVPDLRPYAYAVIDDRVLLVDPTTNVVIDELSQ